MRKLLLLSLFAALAVGCRKDGADYRFATTNDAIENGSLTGTNIHFSGTMTVTDAQGKTFTGKECWFEFAGGSNDFALYMHKARFAANMQRVEMRLYEVPYTPEGDKSLRFEMLEIIPDILNANEVGGGVSYQPAEPYKITALEGSINEINCRISFICAETYHVTYVGRQIILQ